MIRAGLLSLMLLTCISEPGTAQETPSAKSLYEAAAREQQAGKFAVAEPLWQQFVKAYPKHPSTGRALHSLGVCLLQQQKYEAAIEALTSARERKTPPTEQVQWNLALAAYQLAEQSPTDTNRNRANGELDAVMALEKSSEIQQDTARFYRGKLAQRANDSKTATIYFQELVKGKRSLAPFALHALAEMSESVQEWKAAITFREQLLDQYTDHSLANTNRLTLADDYRETNQLQEAAVQYEVLSRTENFADVDYALYRLAEIRFGERNWKVAGELLQTVQQKYPDSTLKQSSHALLGQTLFQQQQWKAAATQFASVTQKPPLPEARYFLARCAQEQDDHQQAAMLLERWRANYSRHPLFAEVTWRLAVSRYQLSEFETAATLLESLLKIKPDNGREVQHWLARTRMKLKQFAQALTLYALLLKPEQKPTAELLQEGIFAALQSGNSAEALNWLTVLQTSFPKTVITDQTVITTVRWLAAQQQPEAAVKLCSWKTTTERAATIAELLYLEGHSLGTLKRFAAAEKSFAELTTNYPETSFAPAAWYAMAVMQERQEQPDKAVESYQQLIDNFPTHSLAKPATMRMKLLQQ